jgi:hypothetical protein
MANAPSNLGMKGPKNAPMGAKICVTVSMCSQPRCAAAGFEIMFDAGQLFDRMPHDMGGAHPAVWLQCKRLHASGWGVVLGVRSFNAACFLTGKPVF